MKHQQVWRLRWGTGDRNTMTGTHEPGRGLLRSSSRGSRWLHSAHSPHIVTCIRPIITVSLCKRRNLFGPSERSCQTGGGGSWARSTSRRLAWASASRQALSSMAIHVGATGKNPVSVLLQRGRCMLWGPACDLARLLPYHGGGFRRIDLIRPAVL
jgi:hypothetical protein